MKPVTWKFVLLSMLMPVLAACSSPSDPVLEVDVQPARETVADPVPVSLRLIAKAVLGGSITERLDFIQFLTTPCTTADGLGGPPKCSEGQADGTPVEVFPVGGSEGSFADRESIERTLEFAVIGLHAVYRVSVPSNEAYWPAGEYALLFDRSQNDLPIPITVLVAEGRIVRINFGVGTSAADMLMNIPVEDILVPPGEVDKWLSGG